MTLSPAHSTPSCVGGGQGRRGGEGKWGVACFYVAAPGIQLEGRDYAFMLGRRRVKQC